jgi:BirA family biotin operon repressor/biotin-[acetyl-CoA-carboxylase] ligase
VPKDILSAQGIEGLLCENLKKKIKIDIRETVGSTNDELKALARDGAKEGYLLISEHQTAGKGRIGRSFFSPDGTGIYMSLLLKPELSPEKSTLVTSAAAVAMCRAIEKIDGENPSIKWVNDIFCKGEKVCGILTEGSFTSQEKLDYAIVGVGVNLYTPRNGFPTELEGVAGAVLDKVSEAKKNTLVSEFINEFFCLYDRLSEAVHMDEYRKRCFVLGKEIFILGHEEKTPAKAISIDDNCNLVARLENGELVTLGTGEISVRLVHL